MPSTKKPCPHLLLRERRHKYRRGGKLPHRQSARYLRLHSHHAEAEKRRDVKPNLEGKKKKKRKNIDRIFELIGPYDNDQNKRSLPILSYIEVTISEENRGLFNMRNGVYEQTIRWKNIKSQLFTDSPTMSQIDTLAILDSCYPPKITDKITARNCQLMVGAYSKI